MQGRCGWDRDPSARALRTVAPPAQGLNPRALSRPAGAETGPSRGGSRVLTPVYPTSRPGAFRKGVAGQRQVVLRLRSMEGPLAFDGHGGVGSGGGGRVPLGPDGGGGGGGDGVDTHGGRQSRRGPHSRPETVPEVPSAAPPSVSSRSRVRVRVTWVPRSCHPVQRRIMPPSKPCWRRGEGGWGGKSRRTVASTRPRFCGVGLHAHSRHICRRSKRVTLGPSPHPPPWSVSPRPKVTIFHPPLRPSPVSNVPPPRNNRLD